MASLLGKIPTESVRRRISLLKRSAGIVGPDLSPHLDGEGGEGQQVGSCGLEVVGGLGQDRVDVVQEAVELGLDGCCVGLVVDASGAWP